MTTNSNIVKTTINYDVAPSRFRDTKDDVTALKSLLEKLSKDYGEEKITKVTNNFLFGYEFERINQEFDLLKEVETP